MGKHLFIVIIVFCAVRVIKHQKMLSRQAVESQSVDILRILLDIVLHILLQLMEYEQRVVLNNLSRSLPT